MHQAVHHAAELVELLLVVNHFRAGHAGDRVILAQENRLLGTDLFAKSAVNAADHVDVEFLRKLLHFGEFALRRNFAGRDFDGARRADEFAKLARHAALAALFVRHQRRRAAIMLAAGARPIFPRDIA